MDYFKQRRVYRSFKQIEYHISNGQNNLYRELLDYANDEGHLDHWFPMRNSALVNLTGLSESGVVKARNELLVANLIEYRPGSKKSKKAPQYKIVCLYSQKTKVQQVGNGKYSKQSRTCTANSQEPVQQTGQQKELTSTVPRLDQDYINHDDEKSPLRLANEYWGQNRPLNSVLQDAILRWCNDWPNEMIAYALELAYEKSVDMQGAKPYVNAILNDWGSKSIATLEDAKANKKPKKRYANGLKVNSKQSTDYGQTLYTYYEKEQRFSPNMTFDEYVAKKRLNERDRQALEHYIHSLEGNA